MLFDLGLENTFNFNKHYSETGLVYTQRTSDYYHLKNLNVIVSTVDSNHKKYQSINLSKACHLHKIGYYPTGTKGIYYGHVLDDFLNLHYSIDDYPQFCKSSGIPYSTEELRESYGFDDVNNPDWKEKRDATHLKNGKIKPQGEIIDSYGSADSIDQILKEYINVILNPNYKVCIQISILTPTGNPGYRWHKNGRYIGKQKKLHEHLGDETHIEYILQYNFYLIKEAKT